ncbi:MAG: hypothetical protein HUJ68_13260 [Clostridia bacterium]|mgnify:CR=1 FL=1|nr:hypothetical protein [Clostridia bacterium]
MDYEFLNPQGSGEKYSNNKAIDKIIRSGADFEGNQFQAMLYWFDENGSMENVFYQYFSGYSSTLVYEKSNLKDQNNPINSIDSKLDYDTKYKQAILSKEGFLVRFANIKMPTIKKESYTIKVGMQTIEKVKTTQNITPQATFNFRLDANLEWLDFFNKASGNYSTLTQNNNGLSDWRTNISQVTKFFTPSNYTTTNRLCLFVNSNCFDITNQLYRFKEDFEEQRNFIPFSYVFQDVKFLGPSNVSYSSEGAGSQDVSVDFIYKRLRKIRNVNGTIEVV